MTIPQLSAEQKEAGLKKAQFLRSERTAIRKSLKQGDITLGNVFSRSDEEAIGKMRVKYLLESLPNVGKITAQRLLEEVGINETRRVQGLGPRQKEELINRLIR